jgi:hypothetical protein
MTTVDQVINFCAPWLAFGILGFVMWKAFHSLLEPPLAWIGNKLMEWKEGREEMTTTRRVPFANSLRERGERYIEFE